MAGRGRGRGSGGAGRGGGPFQTGSSFMGGFTYGDIAKASEAEMTKTLFPVSIRTAGRHSRQLTIKLIRRNNRCQNGKIRQRKKCDHSDTIAHTCVVCASQRTMWLCLRLRTVRWHCDIAGLADIKSTTASMVKYSDRYEEPVEVMPSLTDAEQKERLNPAFFPTAIWQAFFEKQPKQRWSSLLTR